MYIKPASPKNSKLPVSETMPPVPTQGSKMPSSFGTTVNWKMALTMLEQHQSAQSPYVVPFKSGNSDAKIFFGHPIDASFPQQSPGMKPFESPAVMPTPLNQALHHLASRSSATNLKEKMGLGSMFSAEFSKEAAKVTHGISPSPLVPHEYTGRGISPMLL